MPVRSLRDGTIVLRVDDDGVGSEGTVTVDIEEGDLSYVERRPVNPILDRGALSHFRPAEDESVDLGFSMKFQSFTTHVDPSPHDVLTRQGGAAAWLSQEAESDPFAIDLQFTVTDPAGGGSEVISFDRFHPEDIAFAEGEPNDTLVVSGRGFKRAFLVPDQIPGLFAWFDANSITGLADGASVTTWDDRSNNENDVTQAVAGEKPTFQTNEINTTLPIVRFDGVDDNLERTLDATIEQSYTIFAVMKHVTGSVTVDEHMIGGEDNAAASSGAILAQQATPDQVAAFAGINSPIANLGAAFFVLIVAFDGATSVARYNRTQTTESVGARNLKKLVLGADGAGTGAFADVDVAEVAYYDRKLTVSQMRALEDYATWKYAV